MKFSDKVKHVLKNPTVFYHYIKDKYRDKFRAPKKDPLEEIKEYWNDSKNSRKRQSQSHWIGKGKWTDKKSWKKEGEAQYKRLKKLNKLASTPISSMVEWGSGGGINALRLSKEVETFYGVDISKPNLNECKTQVEKSGYKGFYPILINPNHPEEALNKIPKIDFFMCVAVFQHFPSKEYGERIVKIANNLLKKKGVALIQIRYDDEKEKYKPKIKDYYKNATTFTSYPIKEFKKILTDIGFKILALELKPEINYAYYYLKK